MSDHAQSLALALELIQCALSSGPERRCPWCGGAAPPSPYRSLPPRGVHAPDCRAVALLTACHWSAPKDSPAPSQDGVAKPSEPTAPAAPGTLPERGLCATCGREHVPGVWWPRHMFRPRLRVRA